MEPIPNEPIPDTNRYLTYEQMHLINSFRFFMLDMAIYSRFISSCVILYKDCFDAVFARLLQVPYDSYQQMATYLGREKAAGYYNLVNQHLIIMVELLQALKAGNQQETDALLKKWYQNAEESSVYLASINPYWTKEQWHNLFYQYLQLLLNQALTMQNRNFAQSVQIFDQIRYHAIVMGDQLASGIMQLLNVQPPQMVPPGTIASPEPVAPPAPAPQVPVTPAPVKSPTGPVPPVRSFR